MQLVLKTRDEAAAVDQANETAKRRRETAPIETTLPPVIKIDSPAADGTFSGDSVEVTFSVRSPSGLPVDRVDALIDGRPVEARGVAPAASQSGDQRTLTVPAPARDFELGLVARSGAAASEVARVRLVYAGEAASETATLKPKLYAVTIGVSDYVDPDLRLGYAADDARGFAQVLLRQKGGLYSDVQVKILADRQVTRASVVEALDWLGESVTARDVAMVLIAGHGVTDEKQNYWFLPADVSMKHLVVERGLAGRHPSRDARGLRQGDTVPRHLSRQPGGRGRARSGRRQQRRQRTRQDRERADRILVLAGTRALGRVGEIRARRLHRGADRRASTSARRTCCTRASSRSPVSTPGSPIASSNSPKGASTPS